MFSHNSCDNNFFTVSCWSAVFIQATDCGVRMGRVQIFLLLLSLKGFSFQRTREKEHQRHGKSKIKNYFMSLASKWLRNLRPSLQRKTIIIVYNNWFKFNSWYFRFFGLNSSWTSNFLVQCIISHSDLMGLIKRDFFSIYG